MSQGKSVVFFVLSGGAFACSSAAFSVGSDAGDASRGAPDATSGRDAANDVTSDATESRDASRADAGDAEANPGTDGAADSSAADARDAATHGCTYTGKPRGTLDVLASAGSGSAIADFDIDCQTLFGIDTLGGIASCPASGCGVNPTTVVPESTFVPGKSSLRISPTGLLVLNPMSTPLLEPPTDAAPPPPIRLYALGRDGAGIQAIVTLPPDAWSSGASPLLGTPGFTSFFESRGVPPESPSGSGSPLEVVQFGADAGSDGGTGRLVSFPGDYSGGPNAGPASASVSTDGKTEYRTTIGITGVSSITRLDLTTTDTTGTAYRTAATETKANAVVSSEALVVWTETPLQPDAGLPVTYVCAAQAPCAAPVAVSGLGAYAQIALASETLFVLNASNDLATCKTTDLVAGTCTPNLLHSSLPAIGRFQADADNVYVLAADGSQIVRIAR